MILQLQKRTLLLLITMSVHFFYAQTKNVPFKYTQQGQGIIDFLSIGMPNKEANMDFLGIHYNLKVNDIAYLGTGIYGAIGGTRGGFFTLGINAGIQPKITENIFIDAGVHFGGGGGASAPDGGGAFIIPHLNLGYNLNFISLSAGYSYVNFFDKGNIKGNQFYAQIQLPLNFDYTNYENKEKQFNRVNLQLTKWNQAKNKLSLMIHANNLAIGRNSKFVSGISANGKTIRLAGFELNSYFNDSWFYFVKADGAYHGIQAGYMDILLGVGYNLSIHKNTTNILAKFGIGAGGGGGIDTQGGLLIYPDISIEQKLFNDVFLTVNKGFLLSPNQYFYSSTLGFGVKYYLEKDGIINTESSKFKFKGLEAIIQQEIYFNANRNNHTELDMQQIGLQINFFVNKHLFFAGQTSFANFGNAGAYAEGIVGLGMQTKSIVKNKLNLFGQILVGAAGGGGISTGQGLIIKPSIGINYKLTTKLSVRSSFGYVKALKGGLQNSFSNIGINYHISFLNRK